MIQRIQSLWLLLASLSVCLLSFFPVATFAPNENTPGVVFSFYAYGLDYVPAFSDMLDGLYTSLLKYTVVAVLLVCAVTPFIAIFIYRNRPRQVQLARLTMLLNAALMVAFFMLSDFFANLGTAFFTEEKILLINYNVGIYAPIAALVFLWLSVRYIKKDDKLVRSADRIR